MGKHRTQEQKLKDALAQLDAGSSIANRDIRRILGANYSEYEQAFIEARAQNDLFKPPKRTERQREAEQAIKLALMHMTRGTRSEGRLMEHATELVQQLDAKDLHEMACWEPHPETGTLEIAWNDLVLYGTNIYADLQPSYIEDLKRDTLRQVVEGLLSERFGYQTDPELDEDLLQAKLAALKARH